MELNIFTSKMGVLYRISFWEIFWYTIIKRIWKFHNKWSIGVYNYKSVVLNHPIENIKQMIGKEKLRGVNSIKFWNSLSLYNHQ